jgi:hypothetical protein
MGFSKSEASGARAQALGRSRDLNAKAQEWKNGASTVVYAFRSDVAELGRAL